MHASAAILVRASMVILPPDHKGEVPAGYFTARSKTNLVLVGARAKRCVAALFGRGHVQLGGEAR
jgi:hypothetical protein